MGLLKTRRLAAMHKQQRAKAGMKPPKAAGTRKGMSFSPSFPNRPRKDSFPQNLYAHSLQTVDSFASLASAPLHIL